MKCLICGEERKIKYSNVKDYLLGSNNLSDICYCKKDGLMWVNNEINNDNLRDAYTGYHAHADFPSPNLSDSIKAFEKLGLGFYIKKITNKNVLDFGCGSGSFLKQVKVLGGNAFGTEFDGGPLVKLKEIFGEKYIKNDKELFNLEDNFFDIIVMNHVIEHLDNPLEVISNLHRILNNGGIIVVATPNNTSLGHLLFGKRWRGLEPPRHRFIFSKKSLIKIFSLNNFSVSRVLFSSKMARGIFVSGLFPSLESMKNKPSWRYIVHLFGGIFYLFEIFLGFIGFNKLKEEIIIIFNKE